MQIIPIKRLLLSLPELFAVAVVMVVGCNNTQSPSIESPNTESPNTESPNTKSPTATNIQNIIAEHIEAVGGAPAIKQIKTIRKFSSVMTTAPTGNATGTTEEMFDLIADSGWVGLDLGLYQESKGWIGQEGWKKTSFERVRDLTAEELPLDKIGMPVSIIFTLKDTFGSAAFLPPTKYKFNDQDCVKVEIVESPLALYVNEKTKLIEGIEVPNLMRITLSNYKEVNGVQVPYHTKVEIFVVNTTVTSDLKKVEFNGKLDANNFSKPDN
jgi:hypothetical protein